jgi:hypothetical protein
LNAFSVKTGPSSGGILSRLFVAGAKRTDAGVYSCVFGNARASVMVHVLAGNFIPYQIKYQYRNAISPFQESTRTPYSTDPDVCFPSI